MIIFLQYSVCAIITEGTKLCTFYKKYSNNTRLTQAVNKDKTSACVLPATIDNTEACSGISTGLKNSTILPNLVVLITVEVKYIEVLVLGGATPENRSTAMYRQLQTTNVRISKFLILVID